MHIRAACAPGKPLVIHTRAASADTIAIMREESARDAGGVMHCFTETWDVARAALDLGFHISLSGIVTFKNAHDVKDVARRVPLDRLLIETDAPYLAPVPFRGKRNQPAYVPHVAAEIAQLRGVPADDDRARDDGQLLPPVPDRRRRGRLMSTDRRRRDGCSCTSPRALSSRACLAAAPVARAQSVADDFVIAVANDRVARGRSACSRRAPIPTCVDKNGDPVLVIAVRAGSAAIARSPARRTRERQRDAPNSATRALMVAALGGRLEIVKKLRARGADVKQPGWNAADLRRDRRPRRGRPLPSRRGRRTSMRHRRTARRR